MNRARLLTHGILIAVGVVVGIRGQQQTTDERIARIERALLPPVIVQGRPLETRSLQDRMRELTIPGVS